MTHQKANHNEIPKYEDLQQGTLYAFTYAPSDRQQFWEELDRFELFKKKIGTFFMSILGKTYIKFRIELSPHGRLHLHGYMTIDDKMSFYLYTIPKIEEFGQIHLKPINDPIKWDAYCIKQNLEQDWHYLPIVHKPLKPKKMKSP